VWLNVHLKEGREAGEIAARALAKAGRLHQAFLACGAEAAQAAHAAAPGIKICNMERQVGSLGYIDETIAVKAEFIQLVGLESGPLKENCRSSKNTEFTSISLVSRNRKASVACLRPAWISRS